VEVDYILMTVATALLAYIEHRARTETSDIRCSLAVVESRLNRLEQDGETLANLRLDVEVLRRDAEGVDGDEVGDGMSQNAPTATRTLR
jgi:hypothetical protein